MITNIFFFSFVRSGTIFFALRPIPNLFVNKNVIKPHFPPKQGKNYGVGNVLGNFAHFAGNFEKYLLETLAASQSQYCVFLSFKSWQDYSALQVGQPVQQPIL